MNVVALNGNSLVTEVKQVGVNYKLQSNEVEVVDFKFELMNKRYENGIFIMIEEDIAGPSIEEKILYETQYQTMLIETSMSF